MQESLAGVAVSQAYSQQPANEARFAALADATATARVRSVELMARFFPFLQLLSIVAKAHRARGRRPPDRRRAR